MDGIKALVTGGTGFIGSHVVDRLLADGHAVRVLSRKAESSQRGKNGVEIVQGDLEAPATVIAAMEGMDIFYHIGEIKNVRKAASEKNVNLMRAIIENISAGGVRRIVFVSSITVAGIPAETPADEDTKPAVVLNDHYTAYKRECERLLVDNLQGCEYSIIRPAPVYGPGSRYLGRLVNAVERYGPVGVPFIGNARNIAPLIYVKDLAEAVYLSGLKPAAAGRKFNITDGLSHSWHDFFSAISGFLGKKLRIVPLPPFFLKMAALPLDLLSGFFGVEIDPLRYVDYFSKDIYFDNARACNLLGWRPYYGLEDGIKEMMDWYRKGKDNQPL